MKENVLLNFPTTASPPVHVSELDWGTTPPPSLPSNPDIILAADCVYFEPAFPLLVETLCGLCPVGEDREVLFCWKKRRKVSSRLGLGHSLESYKTFRTNVISFLSFRIRRHTLQADMRFFKMLKKHFSSSPVEDDRPGERERYEREGVKLMRLVRTK